MLQLYIHINVHKAITHRQKKFQTTNIQVWILTHKLENVNYAESELYFASKTR